MGSRHGAVDWCKQRVHRRAFCGIYWVVVTVANTCNVPRKERNFLQLLLRGAGAQHGLIQPRPFDLKEGIPARVWSANVSSPPDRHIQSSEPAPDQ